MGEHSIFSGGYLLTFGSQIHKVKILFLFKQNFLNMVLQESIITLKKNAITVYFIILETLQEKRILAFGVMNNSQLNIEQLLSNPSLKEFQSIGLIDERALRNYLIRYEYQELRKHVHNFQLSFFYQINITFPVILLIPSSSENNKISSLCFPFQTNLKQVSAKP